MVSEKAKIQREQQNRFLSHIDDVYSSLSPYRNFLDLDDIKTLCENFKKKTEDFYSSNRKFNIAVIGQVKAGKSSFLNTLLFKGASLLPYALTPKTSTLTMIEYSEESCICVEFYDVYEWAELKKNARISIDTPQVHAAREILQMSQQSKISVDKCFEMQRQEIKVTNLSEINLLLEDYVGESGDYTPFVKSLTLKVALDEIKDITIVDTPGLNDPVSSRRIKTQEFIERCDAAFYLSRASYFMDSNDIALISSQLPQKGVKKLILIASQYDNALLDVMSGGESLADAELHLNEILTNRAKECIKQIAENLIKNGCSQEVVDVVKNCSTPYFISSVVQNMALTPKSQYSELCKHVYFQLFKKTRVSKAKLNDISGFNVVREVFLHMVEQKENLLKEKELSFALVANSELKHILNEKRADMQENVELFKGGELKSCKDDIIKLNEKIKGIKQVINEIFNDCYADLEQNSFDNASRLFESRALIKPDVKKGIEVVNVGISVSDRVWWNPFSWNKTHKEYVTRQRIYEYAQIKDFVEEIQFIEQGADELYRALCDELMAAVDLKERLLKELLPFANSNAININTILEKTIRKLTIPPLQVDFEAYENQLLQKYDETILDKEKAHEMIKESERTVEKLIDEITCRILANLRTFASSTKNANSHLCELILTKQYEQQKELAEFYDKNLKRLSKQQEAIEIISHYV